MANTYRINDINGDGYVTYSITPDYGQPIYTGDLVTISGTVYTKEYAIRSMEVIYGLEPGSGVGGVSKNISIGKGKTGKFSFVFNMPETMISFQQKSIRLYLTFNTYDTANFEWNVGGMVLSSEDKYISYEKYKLLPNIIDMDFDRANADGKWSNEGLYFQCRSLKISIAQGANVNDITKATIIARGGEEDLTTELNIEQLQAALSETGYTEITPQIFIEPSLLGITYSITLTLGDEYEQVVYEDIVSRAFANIHLSGAKTGGVAFGMFSTATEGSPIFECAYPAHLYGGIGDETVKILSNVIYPVGSVFFCTEEVSPVDVFGGKWEQIKDRFIVAAGSSYTEGATGGSASYSLSVSHRHTSPAGFAGGILGVVKINGSVNGGRGDSYASVNAEHTGNLGSDISLGYTGNATVSATIPTIPPYVAVCVWKRTELYNMDEDSAMSTMIRNVRRLSYEQLEDK